MSQTLNLTIPTINLIERKADRYRRLIATERECLVNILDILNAPMT
ncbi:MAG: hypothetical protein U0936_16440 [Planctomycetaceae bacterium]